MSEIGRRTSCDPRLMTCQADETEQTSQTKKSETASRDRRVQTPTQRPPSTEERRHASQAAIAAAQSAKTPRAAGALVSQDLSVMPEAVLDRQAVALRAKLREASYPDREHDAAELVAVEKELGKRNTARTDAAREAHGGVKLCKRTADLPGSSIHGAQHWWLRTTTKEAGMGPSTGNVPGHGELVPETFDTKMIDHSKEPKTDCTPIVADEDCVDRELQLDERTGTWIPGINDCHTVVKKIIAKCREESIDKALQGNAERLSGDARAQ